MLDADSKITLNQCSKTAKLTAPKTIGHRRFMNNPHLNSRDMDFYLYEFLETQSLLQRPRYAQHSIETFNAAVEGAKAIANKYYANHYSKSDANEPTFDGEVVHLVPETQKAWDAVADFGLMAAHHDESEGGLQLPEIICKVAGAYIQAANCASSGYYFVTASAGNLIRAFGSEQHKRLFLHPMMDGRYSGTMALTEPAQGSALADIKTSATPQADGTYRICGQKIYITNGDHSLTENIIHLVLAKIPGAPLGVHGISLFIVPKVMVNADGTLGARNDVALAGLLHKMGNRNATSTVLNFGENEGAVGFLLGEPHRGLSHMFEMMNDLRVGVGLGAAVLATRGYLHALDFARERPQGRLPSNKDPLSPQVNIIEHADVRRMLLAQKAYAEGSMALCLYAASLVEDAQTAETDMARQRAADLLDFLTPVVKSFPSKYGCISNDLAIQVLGGSGYIRDYPVEQLYRDQRLNPIHEGTEGIHGLDLLGRKVSMCGGHNYRLFLAAIRADLEDAAGIALVVDFIAPIQAAVERIERVTDKLLLVIATDPNRGLANATVYLDMFGQVVIAWIWLKQAMIAAQRIPPQTELGVDPEADFYRGKLHAARYFMQWELPQTIQKAALLDVNDSTCFNMKNEYF